MGRRLRAGFGLAMAVALAGCASWATPTPTIAWTSVSAEKLAAAYAADPGGAAQHYQGQDLRVHGVVASVIQPFPDAAWVMLEGSEDLYVGCYAGSYTEINSLPVGDPITLVGVGSPQSTVTAKGTTYPYVEIGDCVAVREGDPLPSAQPSPRPTP